MKWIDKYSWIGNFRQRMVSALLGAVLLFTGTIVEAGVFKLDLRGCKAGPDNGYHVELVSDIHPGHPDFNMYFCDYDAYTEGNLKQWAELDMVPHAIVVSNTTGSTQDFTFAVGGDYKDTNDPNIIGWDYITELTLDINATRLLAVRDGLDPDTVEAACKAVGSIATQTIVISPDQSEIFRVVDVTGFPDGLTCVPVYNMRLAIGSSNYSGSSLQSRLISIAGAANVGDQTLPLPDIISTGLSKTMSAVQGGSRTWSVSKSASLATVDFGDTCDQATPLNKDVNITVSWVKGDVTPAGNVNVTTVISAINTSQRDINISVIDRLYSGTTLLDTDTSCQDTVPKNTANYEVCTNTFTISEANAIDLNDIATATYIDPDAPNAPILAEVNATASAIVQGSENNTDENATIKDYEWISGNNLSYSVADPGSGTFDNYIAGVDTTDDVNWTSDLQTDSGSVTFTKTIYTVQGTEASGTLSDVATLTGSDGFGTDSGTPLSINLISSPTVTLTITKVMDVNDIPIGGLDFNFTVRSEFVDFNETFTIEVNSTTPSNSIIISGLSPSLYNVKEVAKIGYAVDGNATRVVDLTLPTCAATEIFTNIIADRPAAKVRKITLPAGSEAGWTMTLYKQDVSDPSVWTIINTDITTSGDWIILAQKDTLQKGTYKIEEDIDAHPEWYNVGVDVDCAFTYDPADGNRSDYECIFANAQYSEIIINKVVDGSSTDAFTFDQDINASDPLSLDDGGSKTYSNLIPGTYHVTETDPAVNDLLSDHFLSGLECVETGGVSNSVTDLNLQEATIQLEAGESVECTFTNQERGKITVLKTENGGPSSQVWTFTLQGIEGIIERTTNFAGELNLEEIRLTAGRTYTLCEVELPIEWDADWMLNGVSITPTIRSHADHNDFQHIDLCYDFTVGVGETAAFEIDNILPGLAHIGDFVWYDDNNNGIRDAIEEPVRGFTATLLDVNGGVVATQLTDANGKYGFDVAPGTYSVRFSGLTPEYIFSTKQNDSVADSNGNTEQVTVAAGESRLDRDAGIFCINPLKGASSSGGDAMGKLSAALMILMTVMIGLFFVRREEQENRI